MVEPLLHIERRNAAGDVELRVQGELDVGTAPDLRAALDRELRNGNACIVLDLDGVTLMDSTGLAEVIAASNAVRRAQRRLVVRCSGGSEARLLFDLSGVGHAMDIRP